MKYFSEHEFNGWYGRLSPELKIALDTFRGVWGYPVIISPAEGAVGRHLGDSKSQHNIDKWGEVRAVDIFPYGLDSYSDAVRAIQCAKESGFTGIGIYPEWSPQCGMHVDVRPGNHIATWGQVDGEYVSIQIALNELR